LGACSQQLEALKKLRSTGEQIVKVHHVTVNDGGRAIVGTVQAEIVGAREKIEGQSDELTPHAAGAALLGHIEAYEAALPSRSGSGQDRVLPLQDRERAIAGRTGCAQSAGGRLSRPTRCRWRH
jgi:hypothetical protein